MIPDIDIDINIDPIYEFFNPVIYNQKKIINPIYKNNISKTIKKSLYYKYILPNIYNKYYLKNN